MKKDYEKPMATVISFQLGEDLMVGGETGASVPPGGFWEQSLDPTDNGYQLH